MQAVVFDGPASDDSTTRVTEVAVPEPGAGDVAVDVAAAGINFRDVMARRGDRGYADRWPFVPGFAVAGTVRALGAGVGDLAVGDRVTALTVEGGLAEVAVASAAVTVPTPDAVPDTHAATVPGALVTAWLLLHVTGRLRAGETVLVHSAAGGVGTAVAALARAAGAGRLVGTVGTSGRAEEARRAGYDAVVARSEASDLAGELRAALGGRGADLVLDPQGTERLDDDLAVAAPGARIVLFGNAGGGVPGALPAFGRLLGGNVALAGFSLAGLTQDAPERVGAALRSVLDELAGGRIDVTPSVHHGLGETAVAHERMSRGTGGGTSVVLVGAPTG